MPDLWQIEETEFNPARQHTWETLLTVGNGYFGTRGTFEEGFPDASPATFIHGLYGPVPLYHQELINVPHWPSMELVFEGEPFRLERARISAYRRWLDLRTGILHRTVRWHPTTDHTLELHFERMASLVEPHVGVVRLTARSISGDGTFILRSGLNAYVDNLRYRHWKVVDEGILSEGEIYLLLESLGNGRRLAMVAQLIPLFTPSSPSLTFMPCLHCPTLELQVRLQAGQRLVVEKRVALVTDQEDSDPLGRARQVLANLRRRAPEAPWEAQEKEWGRIWQRVDVEIEGDPAAAQGVRFSLYHLIIAAPRHTDRTSIPARGLSGFAYRGHIFWDTEIFMLPFFIYTQPEIARRLLRFRYLTLPQALERARALGYRGAMYPWETVPDGTEATPRWILSRSGEPVRIWTGDREHHITADVAYAVWQYWQATGDDEWMAEEGAAILLATAAFWASRATYNPQKRRLEIRDVIGPDEYHEHVHNNAYTNGMARWNLQAALKVWEWLRSRDPARAEDLAQQLALHSRDMDQWEEIAGALLLPQDERTGIIEQFEGFFELESIDLRAFEERTQAMDEVLGRERIQRTQVVKQPDVLMLLYLLPDTFGPEALRAAWNYYEPRTDHRFGSSLGPAIHAALGARVGEMEAAYRHFMHAARIDLDDLRGNTADGIHMATCGGVWQAVVFGFAGVKLKDHPILVDPRLPEAWERLSFPLAYRGRRWRVELSRSGGYVEPEEALRSSA